MKITTLLAISVAAALGSVTAFANDTHIKLIPNSHGQMTPLYVSCATSVGIYSGGTGISTGANGSTGSATQLMWRDNGHGQTVPMFVDK